MALARCDVLCEYHALRRADSDRAGAASHRLIYIVTPTSHTLATVAFKLGFVVPDTLYFAWPLTWGNFEIWRFFTNFIFFGDFSFPFLIQLYLLVTYSSRLEKNPFPSGGGTHEGTTADYVWMMVLGGLTMSLCNILFATLDPPVATMTGELLYSRWPAMAPSMVFMILYLWSKRNPLAIAGFFGFKFQAFYLPWVFLVFHVLVGASIEKDLLGIAAGHLYYFLLEELPYTETPMRGKHLITTPQWLQNMMQPAAYDTGPAPAAAFGGQGRPLGRE